MRKLFTLLVLLAALCGGGWLAWALWVPIAAPGQRTVLLRPGFSTRRIARELKSAGVIRSSHAFIFWHYLDHRESLKAAGFEQVKTIRTPMAPSPLILVQTCGAVRTITISAVEKILAVK